MLKEIHLHLKITNKKQTNLLYYEDYIGTKRAIEKALESDKDEVIHTTQTHFLSFKYLPARLFVHCYNKSNEDDEEIHEITLEHCEGTEKELRLAHNLERMLLAGSFDWFNPNKEK